MQVLHCFIFYFCRRAVIDLRAALIIMVSLFIAFRNRILLKIFNYSIHDIFERKIFATDCYRFLNDDDAVYQILLRFVMYELIKNTFYSTLSYGFPVHRLSKLQILFSH